MIARQYGYKRPELKFDSSHAACALAFIATHRGGIGGGYFIQFGSGFDADSRADLVFRRQIDCGRPHLVFDSSMDGRGDFLLHTNAVR